MAKGYIFNRKYFHATESAISCVLWLNIKAKEDEWDLDAYDIQEDNAEYVNTVHLRRATHSTSEYYDKRPLPVYEETNVVLANDGYPKGLLPAKGRPPIYSDDIIGYMENCSMNFNALNALLIRCNWYKGLKEAHGFHLRKDNYLLQLPPYLSKYYPEDEWFHKGVYSTTADGGDAYTHDPQFLKSCLIYTCLSNQNKCLSFDGSDGRRYQNELCFDDTRAEKPLALKDLEKYAASKANALDNDEEKLMEVWMQILEEARKTAGYNSEFNYGVYQISKELNTSHVVGTGKSKKTIYDYPVLNGHLDTLRVMLKAYYKSHITEKMFKYELLK